MHNNRIEDGNMRFDSIRENRWLPVAVILLLLGLAWMNRFVQDDAYISYRYARNLAQGQGLVWNPGERVEGYTNFLWVLLLVPGWKLHLDALAFSQILGCLAFLGSLIIFYQLSRRIFPSRSTALLSLLLLGTNYSFSCYATGGMETQLQAFLFTALVYLTLVIPGGSPRAARLISLSLLGAAAVLLRLDSFILLLVLFPFLIRGILAEKNSAPGGAARIACLLLPAALLIAAFFSWKYRYYGAVLPNTYWAKAAAGTSPVRGIYYLSLFFHAYWLVPLPAILFFAPGKMWVEGKEIRLILAAIILWCLYVIKVGGDFMEFKLLVPVMPLFFLLFVKTIYSLKQEKIRQMLVALVLIGSLYHALTFTTGVKGIESIPALKGHLEESDQNWRRVGTVLRELFAEPPAEVVIATSAAGAISYYSRLEVVDMLGMNDRWIARNGIIQSSRPGHIRMASHQYLYQRGVNLIIGHPQVEERDAPGRGCYAVRDLERFDLAEIREDLIPSSARVVEIPLDERYRVTVLYLVPHPRVEKVIEEKNLRTYEIERNKGALREDLTE
ncbi:MAG: hypothetical protein JXB45_04425 [Candidatus Krumholzibacteriota bacterium]|nr:hypothetical protein [Candidatus Krumholzibacteriota bacterium]